MYLSHSFTSNKALWILRPEAPTHFQLHTTELFLWQQSFTKFYTVNIIESQIVLFSAPILQIIYIFFTICPSLQWANSKLGKLKVENSITFKRNCEATILL